MSYDEREALTSYVLRWFGQLRTESEVEGMRALHLEEKARALGPHAEPAYRERFRPFLETPAGREALRLGAGEFSRRVADRILADHRRKIRANRCPDCGRIVRTPTARQCFWCGADWHASG